MRHPLRFRKSSRSLGVNCAVVQLTAIAVLGALVLCRPPESRGAFPDDPAKPKTDQPKPERPKASKPKPEKPKADMPAAKDGKDGAKVVFPWRADKEGNIMLLQKLRYQHDGKPQQRESVVRVIPAARYKAEAAKVKPVPTKLAKIRHKSAEWHVQKNGDVVLMQHRAGTGKDAKPATETALVARIPAMAAGAFTNQSIKPPVVAAGQRPTTFWSRGRDGIFTLYQTGIRVPIAHASAAVLTTAAYLDEDYDGVLEESETYSSEESKYLTDLDDDDDAEFDDDADDFEDDDGDGLEDDDEGDDDDDDDDDEDDDDDDDDDDEDGDLDDDGGEDDD